MDTNIKELLLDIILNHTDEGIASIDSKGVFTYYNEKMEEIEEISREDVLGKYILDIYPTSNLKNSIMLETLRVGKPVFGVEQRYKTIKGKEIFSKTTQIPIIKNGRVEGVVEFAKEIKESEGKFLNYFKEKSNYYTFDDFKTNSPDLMLLIEQLKKLKDADSNVLIYGETGTGKEIIAQSIHNNSNRKNKPFIAQNCAAIPETLIESILFGTTKGSFTGATDKIGLFEKADGGTLLLDELNSMPIHLQPKLLRVIEEGRVTRIGGYGEKKVDVKVIATVNIDPALLIEEKKVREDLFYRLCGISIYLPPLRSRKNDIKFLTDLFVESENTFRNKSAKVSEEVMEIFRTYNWNGNVRELKNIIDGAFDFLKNEEEISIKHLSSYFLDKLKKLGIIEESRNSEFGYTEIVENFEKELINNALKESHGNVSEASRILKIKRQTLQHKIKKLKI